MFGNDILGHAYFRAEHEIGILADRFGASINLREVDVVEFGNRERGEADIGDMNECVKARASLGHYVAAEGRKIVRAGIARRNTGCCALVGHKLVGWNSDG